MKFLVHFWHTTFLEKYFNPKLNAPKVFFSPQLKNWNKPTEIKKIIIIKHNNK